MTHENTEPPASDQYVYGASHDPDPDGGYLRACYAALGEEMPDLRVDVNADGTSAVSEVEPRASWPAVSAAIGRSHNPEFCTMCGPEAMTEALRAAAQDTMRYVEQSWPVGSVAGEAPVPQFPRDWVSPWVGIMARAELRHLNDVRKLADAELRARLVAKVHESIVGAAYTDDIHWATLEAMAEVAVDVFTEAVRKGEL